MIGLGGEGEAGQADDGEKWDGEGGERSDGGHHPGGGGGGSLPEVGAKSREEDDSGKSWHFYGGLFIIYCSSYFMVL